MVSGEAIRALVISRARVLVVQKTGWGKSLVYFMATKLLRERGGGPTLLISPLLSLMRDQQVMARQIEVRALSIDSANRDDWNAIAAELAANTCDVLMISGAAGERALPDRGAADPAARHRFVRRR